MARNNRYNKDHTTVSTGFGFVFFVFSKLIFEEGKRKEKKNKQLCFFSLLTHFKFLDVFRDAIVSLHD